MRGSGWIPAITATALCIAACIWPAIALLIEIDLMPSGDEPTVAMTDVGVLLWRSTMWSIGIAIGSVLLGWLPGRVLGSLAPTRWFVPVVVAFAVPICMPNYVMTWSWWQAWPPDSFIHAWVSRHDMVALARETSLAIALICWSWPIVSWCVAGASMNAPMHSNDLMRMVGAPWWRRAAVHLRYDSRGLLLGGLLVALITFNNTISFDLASVFTFGNELRAREALGATPRQLFMTGLPAIGLTLIGASLVWLTLNAPRQQRAEHWQPRRGAIISSASLWIASLFVPVAMLMFNFTAMVRRDGWQPITQFYDYYGEGFINTIGIGICSAAVAAGITIGLTMMWLDHRPAVRWAAHVQALIWLTVAAAPATMIGMALEAAFNHPGALGSALYSTPVALILGHLARFTFLGALLGRWLAMREPAELRDLRRLESPGTLLSFIRAVQPRLVTAAVASFCIVGVMSAGEIIVTTFVRPRGFDVLAPSVLNAMHYQQFDTVMVAVVALLGLSISAAVLLAVIVRLTGRQMHARTAATVIAAAVGAAALAGCSNDGGETQRLDTEYMFGAPGEALGQFNYPRGIAVDADNGRVYVVDKAARIQRFKAVDGTPVLQWKMPAKANGKPTGVAVGPDGNIYVPDTHYYRVIVYDPKGNELRRFGEYGTGPGQFIYPTDVEFDAQGRLYVSEYGGNDRIQVFTPEGRHLFTIGSFGSEPGQFNRPQGMVFNADGTRLYVADAVNHRIQVFNTDGERIGGFGTLGRGPGELSYPYDLTMLPDDTLVVCEFGNHRVQHLTADGRSLSVWGQLGTERGQLQYPWGVDTDGRRLFVLDSGNNRVQVADLP